MAYNNNNNNNNNFYNNPTDPYGQDYAGSGLYSQPPPQPQPIFDAQPQTSDNHDFNNNNPSFGGIGYEDIPSFDAPNPGVPQDAELNFAAEAKAPAAAAETEKKYSWYHVNYYRCYFDVDTKDVAARIFKSLIPIGDNFFDFVSPTPDLYGPFWIASTVAFLMAAAASATTYTNLSATYAAFSTGAIYGYWIIVAALVWAVGRWWLEISLKLVDHLCIYGYSLFTYVPASFILLIPHNWIRWIVMSIVAAISTLFLVKNYFKPYQGTMKKGSIVLLVQAAAHVGLALVFMLKLFIIGSSDSSSSAGSNSGSAGAGSTNSTLLLF